MAFYLFRRNDVENLLANSVESLGNTVPKAATGSASTPLHQAFIRALILGTTPAGYVSLCKVIAGASQPAYNRITAPLLIVAGGDDKTAPLDACKEIFESYGTVKDKKRIEVLDGVGHWHCVEAGEDVAKLIKAFVS